MVTFKMVDLNFHKWKSLGQFFFQSKTYEFFHRTVVFNVSLLNKKLFSKGHYY